MTSKILVALMSLMLVFTGIQTYAAFPTHARTESTVSTEVVNVEKTSNKELVTKKLVEKKLNKISKSKSTDMDKTIYIILAILGFGWLAMGLLSDFEGSNWLISLVLYMLLYFPGLIYSLIKMKDYYN